MTVLVLVLLGVPFAAAGATGLVGHRSDRLAKGIAVGGSGLGLLLAMVVAFSHLGGSAPFGHVYAGSGAPAIELSLYVDQLSAVLLLLAHVVAFLVQVYSLGYLADDPRYPSYAALVSVFTGAMTTVVVADDLWVLLVGWELMGACSYFLISHHWELADARAGAVKAFLMTRTADLGLLFGIIVIGERFGTYRISSLTVELGEAMESSVLFHLEGYELPAVLIAIAVIGKSAQFPLHTWLPDAMPGPTPISALIHAATMVAAGVFLVARLYPFFLASEAAMTLLAVVASVTMFLGAVYALFTHDLKRVLAWSTVSQLAYMFGALAAGAYAAGVLHLLAHGAFKALLFLSAGAVVHSVGGSTSMRSMGGLRTRIPDTFWMMTLGFAALAGVVPLVGFFTKDAIIHGVSDQIPGAILPLWVLRLLLVSTVVTAVLTVAYSLRAWLMVFFGAPAADAEQVHQPPLVMRVPLWLLAVPTVLGGLAVLFPSVLLGPAHDETMFHASTALFMTLLVAVTIAAVVLLWRARQGRDLWRERSLTHPPVDTVYDVALVRPVWALSRVARYGDREVIDAYANGTGWTAGALGRLIRLAQNGNVQGYLMVVVVGAAAIAVAAGVMA